MLSILLIIRFGIDFFPTGEIRSIDTYYNRSYILYEDGLVVLNRVSNKRVFSNPIEEGRMLVYDHEYGDLYIITKNKMLRYLEGSDHLTEINLRGKKIKRIGIGKGYVYLEAYDGYYKLRKGSFFIEKTNEVAATRWKKEVEHSDLNKYPILTPYYYTDNLLNKYPITAINKVDNRLWVGSELGIYIINLNSAMKQHLTFGPISRVFKIVDLDTTVAFLGQKKISFYSPTADTWYYRSYLHDVVGIASYKNYLYIGTKGGLFNIAHGVTLPILKNTILSMNRIGNIIYLHAGSKVLALTPPSETAVEITSLVGTVNKIVTHRNRIYIASDRGFFYLDSLDQEHELIDPRGYAKFGVEDIVSFDEKLLLLANGHLATFSDSDSFEYLTIDDGNSLALGRDQVWIGTKSGVWQYRNDAIKMFHRLPYLHVYDLIEKDRYLWIATIKGLYRIKID